MQNSDPVAAAKQREADAKQTAEMARKEAAEHQKNADSYQQNAGPNPNSPAEKIAAAKAEEEKGYKAEADNRAQSAQGIAERATQEREQAEKTAAAPASQPPTAAPSAPPAAAPAPATPLPHNEGGGQHGGMESHSSGGIRAGEGNAGKNTALLEGVTQDKKTA